MSNFSSQLNLKQGQSLGLTPQLLEGLKLLQYNHHDLTLAINDMLANNILLEQYQQQDFHIEPQLSENWDENNDDIIDYEELSEDIDCDMEWQDLDDDYHIESSYDDPSYTSSTTDSGFDLLDITISQSISFKEKLLNSISEHPFSKEEQDVVNVVLNHLNEYYFLDSPLSTIAKKHRIDEQLLEDVIEQIKYIDSVGVGSQNIQECLSAKLSHNDATQDNVESYAHAYKILSQYFNFLGKKDDIIMRRLRINEQQFEDALSIIKSLSPYPNEEEFSETANHIKPDVYISNKMGVFIAVTNQEFQHNIHINETYADLTKQCTGDEKKFLQSQLKIAKAFINSLDYRQSTILRIANAIVMYQQDFFTLGEMAMKPLKLENISSILDLSNSTVSRIINGKYLFFNHNLYEFKAFFSADITSDKYGEPEKNDLGGSSISAKAIIKKLINEEDSHSPISDTQLMEVLKTKNINISRRTVTKYRGSLGIEKSSKRKQKK